MHRQPRRQDTFQLRDQQEPTQNTYQQEQQQQEQMQRGQQQQQQQQQQQYAQQQQQGGQYYDDEDHSIMDEDSGDDQYIDDEDGSSSLSIPSESIDFDLVYSIQTFVATVEGQANVVKGDSLVLMDDSNSYWWLVRVLKTGEVGYIPAENIETAFERLARLNKHRNVDLASATQAERQEDLRATRERMRAQMARNSPYTQHTSKSVIFTGSFMVHQYPAFIWGNENDVLSSEEEDYESYDEGEEQYGDHPEGMEPDDGMSWDDSAGQKAQEDRVAETSREPRLQQQQDEGVAASLRPGGGQVQASQQQQRSAQPANNQAQLGLGTAPSIRSQSSRERIQSGQQQDPRQQEDGSSPSGRQFVDPLESGETRKISVTPNIAKGPSDSSSRQQQQEPAGKRSTSPASVAQQRTGSQQALHRSVSADSAGSIASRDSSKKSMESSVSSKVKKSGRSTPDDESGGEGTGSTKEKKKKSGMFSGLFSSKKKDKDKKEKGGKGVTSSPGTDGDSYGRVSDDSPPSNNNSPAEQSTATFPNRRPQQDPRKPAGPSSAVSQVSPHASRLAQKDLQEQQLYQQYLNRSPASPPDPSLSYGLQSAATLGLAPSSANNSLTAERPRNSRPGSLIITGSMLEGAMVPELSVMRMFAGENLQSEATFKTVLLNSSTTSAELIRQAIQRFRLPHAEDPNDYFLTIKQYEGDEAVLRKEEKPLEIFEELVESALNIPTVKRSSISSISSNLSMQPAITRLAMNDFTDDSTVKLYLNRRSTFPDGITDIPDEDGVTPTQSTEGPSIRADDSMASVASRDPVDVALSRLNGKPQLSVNTPGNTPERFSAPTGRFSMQVIIYPEDLPDGLVFDPQTEAIIPRSSLHSRPSASVAPAQGVNHQYRKKVFVFPKNTTVAEVIEQSLDMFGIQEGVVDGGDEVEDKVLKRMSKARVRYGLAMHMHNEGGERELNPSSKVLEAFPRPPAFKQPNRRSADMRRRSLDASQLLGSIDDIQPEDPIFILKRATTYRSSASRHRLSAPLDDVALHHVHQRESVTSENSAASEYTSVESASSPRAKQPQLSQRELIAAQRAASRANQSALLNAKPNAEQGVDLLLPDKGVIRSARSGVDERMLYSYVQPDGETYDISDIIEEELWDVGQDRSGGSRAGRPSMDDEDEVSVGRAGSRTGSNRGDLLEDVLVKPRDVVEQRIDQVLAKIKDNKRASSLASYATDASKQLSKSVEERRSPTPRSGSATGRHQGEASSSGSNTPVYQGRSSPQLAGRNGGTHSQQPSIASMMSDYRDSPDHSTGLKSSTTERTTPGTAGRPPIILKDDFGMSNMMAVIEANANAKKPPQPPPMTEVEELLFGSNLQLEDLHPAARDLFAPMFERMENVNKQLDLLLQQTFRA